MREFNDDEIARDILTYDYVFGVSIVTNASQIPHPFVKKAWGLQVLIMLSKVRHLHTESILVFIYQVN